MHRVGNHASGVMMDYTTAQNISNEVLHTLVTKCFDEFPSAYDFIVSEIDISDDEIFDAFKTIFPNWSESYGS